MYLAARSVGSSGSFSVSSGAGFDAGSAGVSAAAEDPGTSPRGRFEARAFRQDAYLGAFSTAEEAALAIARDGRQRGMMSLRGR